MILLDNYIRYSGSGSTWQVEIYPPTRPVKSYYEETVLAAEMIWEAKQGKIHVCYSGGMDSEYALSVFLSLGMDVQPVIIRTQYNDHDTKYAFKFCEERNIKPVIVDLDYDKFVTSGEFLQIAESTQCAAYQYMATMWLTKQIDGTVITGETDPHMFLHTDGKWYIDEIQPVFDHLKYYELHGIHTMPYMIRHTPEQFLSFLIDPTMLKLASNQLPGKTGSYSSKVHVYNNQDKFKIEQRVKQNGYEVIEKSPIFEHPDMQLVRGWKDSKWGSSNFEYNELIGTMLSGNIARGTNGQN